MNDPSAHRSAVLCLLASLLSGLPLVAGISIPTVFVGDPGNADEVTSNGPFGGVDYTYYIGTYEVTNAEYSAFLNAAAVTDPHGLYDPSMMTNNRGGILRTGTSGSYRYSTIDGRANWPVFVSFWDAARFTNWLTTGDTETGVYMLNGVTHPDNHTITRNAAVWAAGGVAMSSEDEWYKAAYYSGSPTGANGKAYWSCPTQTDDIDTTMVNYAYIAGGPTEVGTYTAYPSHYGTYDQGGNAWERNDTIISVDHRGLRGSGYDCMEDFSAHGAVRYSDHPGWDLGFRITSLQPVPEPASSVLLFGLAVSVLTLIRRLKTSSRVSRRIG